MHLQDALGKTTTTTTTTTMAPTTTTTIATEMVTSAVRSTLASVMQSSSESSSITEYPDVTSTSTEYFSQCWTTTDFYGFRVPDIHTLPTSMLVLLAIALLVTFWALVKLIQLLWTYFLCHLLGFGVKWCPGPDSWAIITGATDGIGLSYAKAFARKGYCIMLLSRNPQKLDKVKAEILNECPHCPQVKTMPVDFCLDTIYKQISDEINALPGHVHVLVNNVGMAYKYPEYFTKIINSDKFISDIINCNIVSVTRMTHIVLPLMEARRSGVVINISSFSALFPTPLLALYSASKIYMDYFSRALTAECASRGVVVQSVLPYYVSTNMIRNPGISLMVPSADQFVNAALKTVGIETRSYGYFAHNILAFLQSFFVKFVIGNNLNTRMAFYRMKRFRKGCYKRKGLPHKV